MRIFTPEEQKFILDNQLQDTVQLMLQAKRFAPLPVPELVQQIKARQKAQQKLPSWAKHPRAVFPPTLSVEQSSSEETAAFKATLVQGQMLVDLTGGFGVDSFYFAKSFNQVVHLEQNQELQEIASYNFRLLGAENIQSLAITAEEYLQRMDAPVDVLYLDPARRGHSQERVHLLQDCTPDVLGLLPLLYQKSKAVLLKTAPMLDIDLALQELGSVAQVWVVAVQNECKEVLYLLKPQLTEPPLLTCLNLTPGKEAQPLSFTKTQEENAQASYSEPQRFLYEPNTALLKAGAFRWLSEHYGVNKLHRNSHLYTSTELQAAFPGRIFEIMAQPKASSKELQKLLPQKKANITVRNYPLTVAQLREKVKLKEGGEDYLFATTDLHNKPILLLCKKAGS